MRQSWLSPLAACRSAGAKGLGVFAVEAIPAGTTVAGFGGCVVDRAELDTLDEEHPHPRAPDRRRPLHRRASLPFDDADYVNHSCDPNCGIVGSVLLVTMRDGRRRRGALLRLRHDRHRRLRRVRVLVRDARCAGGRSPAPTGRSPSSATATAAGARPTSSAATRASPRASATVGARWTPRERFVEAVNRPAAEVPLDVAALCIAAHAHPGLDVDAWLARLDALAARLPGTDVRRVARASLRATRASSATSTTTTIPRTRSSTPCSNAGCGIPISLSVLMIAIGRRLGVDVRGVGMPGHFLVLDGARGDVWCDPFHGGARARCRRLPAPVRSRLRRRAARSSPRSSRRRRRPRSSRACWPISNAASSRPIRCSGRGCASCTSRSRASRSRSSSSSPTSSRPPATSCTRPWCSTSSPIAPIGGRPSPTPTPTTAATSCAPARVRLRARMN